MSTIGRKPGFAPVGVAYQAAPFDEAAARQLIAELAARRAADSSHPIRASRLALARAGAQHTVRTAVRTERMGRSGRALNYAGLATAGAALAIGGATLLWSGDGPGRSPGGPIEAGPQGERLAAREVAALSPPPAAAVEPFGRRMAGTRARSPVPQSPSATPLEPQLASLTAPERIEPPLVRADPGSTAPILTTERAAPLPITPPPIPTPVVEVAQVRAAPSIPVTPPASTSPPEPPRGDGAVLVRRQDSGDLLGTGGGAGRSGALGGPSASALRMSSALSGGGGP